MHPEPSEADVESRIYTRGEFCNLTAELQHEFAALDNVKDLVGAYQAALSRSAGQQGNDLYDAGQSIKQSLTTLPNVDLPPDGLSLSPTAFISGAKQPNGSDGGQAFCSWETQTAGPPRAERLRPFHDGMVASHNGIDQRTV